MASDYNKTATRILDVAEGFTQTRGFNGFSYKDIQAEVGVKTSSIHYYFPTKQDLAVAMVERYTARFLEAIASLERKHASALPRLQAFGQLFVAVAREDRFCLCGMLATDTLSLPERARTPVKDFFVQLEKWLVDTLVAGKAGGEVRLHSDGVAEAKHFLAALEGGMLIARTQASVNYLETVLNNALTCLKT